MTLDGRPTNAPLGASLLASRSPVRGLLRHADPVGGVFRLDGYGEALVITNDAWIADAAGVPQHCFLLAGVPALADPARAGAERRDDEEVVLLRVAGTAPLPDESDTQRLRAQATADLLRESWRERPRDADDMIDALTEVEMQTSGLRCDVLGTFYDDEQHGDIALAFGSDTDNVYAWSRLRVFKPHGDSLQAVVSYLEGAHAGQPGVVELGRLRYASTRRRERLARDAGRPTDVPVFVNVEDFVSHKTAVFGMTRLGKSNTNKVIACSTFEHAQERGERIGQLIFDPAAEYAEDNVQGTALASLGPEHVRRYRFGATAAELDRDSGLAPLALNLFDPTQLAAAWEVISLFLRARPRADYVDALLAADPVGPDDDGDFRARHLAQCTRLMLYGCLLKAELEPPAGWTCWAPLKASIRAELADAHDALAFLSTAPTGPRGTHVRLTAAQTLAVCERIAADGAAGRLGPDSAEWYGRTDAIRAMGDVLAGRVGSGPRILNPLRDGLHSAVSGRDYAQAIYDDLTEGRIVIVDLSRGSEATLQFCSERIVGHLIQRAADRFRTGQPMHRIQVFLEEAHVLLNREKFRNPNPRDPYVRLAKEAGKYRIGMVYATQEISSVEEKVLSNTANWIVAHLNNESEVRHLRGRYEFGRFAEQILRAEDVGFVRLKTRSSRYVIPVQVRVFNDDIVRDSLRAAGAAARLRARANGVR